MLACNCFTHPVPAILLEVTNDELEHFQRVFVALDDQLALAEEGCAQRKRESDCPYSHKKPTQDLKVRVGIAKAILGVVDIQVMAKRTHPSAYEALENGARDACCARGKRCVQWEIRISK